MTSIQPAIETSEEERLRNKATVRRLIAAFGAGDSSVIDAIMSPDLDDHTPIPGTTPGRQGVKEQIENLHHAFRDVVFEEQTLLADGDVCFLRWRMTGKHERRMLEGTEPDGRDQVEVLGHEVIRLRDGLIVEHLDYFGRRRGGRVLGKRT